MCWITELANEYDKPKKAKEDIEIFKICRLSHSKDALIPYYYNYVIVPALDEGYNDMTCFKYRLNELAEHTKSIKPIYGHISRQCEIHSGLHSYDKSIVKFSVEKFVCNYRWTTTARGGRMLDHDFVGLDERTMVSAFHTGEKREVAYVEGVIPKGATYYENEWGEMVSNKLILTKYTTIAELVSKH